MKDFFYERKRFVSLDSPMSVKTDIKINNPNCSYSESALDALGTLKNSILETISTEGKSFDGK